MMFKDPTSQMNTNGETGGHSDASSNSNGSFLSNTLTALHLEKPYEALKEKHVPVHRTSMWYYVGGLALMFFIVQILSGVLLLLFYQPSVDMAHKSVERIMTEVPFGALIRSIHSWSANALILTVFIHMFSTFFMKSYRAPREIMWVSGVILLVLMLGFGFSGYLLPWDQTAFFATKIGTEVPRSIPVIGDLISTTMKGSKEVNGTTLTRFFGLHVGILPLIAGLFAALHVSLTALFGSSVPPGTMVKRRTRFFPEYVYGEAIVWLVGFALLVVIAVLYPWDLGKAYDLANPSEPPAGIHPEWYFMFLFQTIKYIPEWVAVLVFTLILIFWTVVPLLDKRARRNQKSPIFTWIGIVAIFYILGMTTLAYFSVTKEIEEAKTEQSAPSQDSTATSPGQTNTSK